MHSYIMLSIYFFGRGDLECFKGELPPDVHRINTGLDSYSPDFVFFLGEQSSPEILCYLLPWTPMNHRAKFHAAIFIVGGEIRHRTNTHTHKCIQ